MNQLFSSLFRNKKIVAAPIATPEPTLDADASNKMTLVERKKFRREMLVKSISDTLTSCGVLSSMYRFKAIPVDERHHRFLVMVDLRKSFIIGAVNKSLASFEPIIKVNAFERFGLRIDGIYWRTNESECSLEFQSTAAKISQTDRFDAPPISSRTYQPVSEEEHSAFIEAMKKGMAPPPLTVGTGEGAKEYSTDLAPFSD